MPSSIFTRIINREIPGYIVAEDDHYIAFLDINPLMLGHTLVVPKKEVDYIFDLDDTTLSGLTLFAKRAAPSGGASPNPIMPTYQSPRTMAPQIPNPIKG